MSKHDHLPAHLTRSFSGTYRLTGRMAVFDDANTPFQKVRLSDCQGDHIAWLNLTLTAPPEGITHLDHVTATGVKSVTGHFMIQEFRAAASDEIQALPPLHSLPRIYCPVPEAFDQLIATTQSLNSVHLKECLKRVLEQQDRLESFLNAPASLNNHHAYAGGLLQHSLEVANNTVAMLRLNDPAQPRILQETCFVAGLLHDIGKTFTYDSKGKPNAAWKLCHHDDLTLEACAEGFAYLDKQARELSLTLRHMLTAASPGARYGKPAAMALARYLRDADGQSAMADNERRVFKQGTGWGFRRSRHQAFWRPDLNVLPL